MARFRTILTAIGRAARRNSKSFSQMSGNNMFYAGAAMALMLDPAVIGLFGILMSLVIFLPSSSDPMTALPKDRLALWPLSNRERHGLHLVSPLLNPVAWLILALMIWKRITWGLWAFVAGFFLAGFVGSRIGTPNAWAPKLPLGGLTHLVRKDLRQFLSALDLYCALLLVVPATYLRVTGQLPADSHIPLTALIVVILSTMPLTLFGLDGEGGMSRYCLWPVAAWRVLISKGIAYLLLAFLVTLPLSPIPGFAACLVSLAAGQWMSVQRMIPQQRWRFRSSKPFSFSIAQILAALIGLGITWRLEWAGLAFCTATYAASLWFCCRRLSGHL